MIESSIMSIREMIDTAFGEQEVNMVNFKLIQTILYILARQLRLLERQVGVNIEPGTAKPSSSISITEVKLQAKVSKPKKKKGTKSAKTQVDVDNQSIADEKSELTKSTKDKPKVNAATLTERKPSKKTEFETAEKSVDVPDKIKDKITKEDRRKKAFKKFIEEIEQNRELELRVVHQRANSREEAEKSPTPMASMDSLEYMQYEKLLVVDRVSKEEAMKSTETQRLPIVTQQQFDQLNDKVKALEKQFGEMSTELPENLQLMKELEKEAASTDEDMSTSLLSNRLKAAETTITQLMDLMTDFASKKGLSIEGNKTKMHSERSIQMDSSRLESRSKQGVSPARSKHWITNDDLENALLVIEEDIMNQVTIITDKTVSNAENALTVARNLEKELDTALNLGNRMEELENLGSEYAEQINTLDTNLSSQMSNYQEQLTQMQHDLECGIEAMLEAVANSASDPIAVAELNTNFTNLQGEIDFTNLKQKKLEENQEALSLELKGLLKQLELLRGIKTDRDEVIDALKDKAGLDALNGLVNEIQFEAVRLDFEKRIKAAYSKFDNQEMQWQRAIDDLQSKLDDKADVQVLEALRYDIDENLDMLKKRIDEIKKIVGEASAAAVSKVILRDSTCISCLTPANMNFSEPNLIPLLPASKAPKITNANTTNKEDNFCYPGQPIPHPIDPRLRVCNRYCGGSHTANARSKLTATIGIRRAATGFQEDGKDGKTHKSTGKTPCIPCNVALTQTTIKLPGHDNMSDISQDFVDQYIVREDNGSITPPYLPED